MIRFAEFTIPRTPPSNNSAELNSKAGKMRLTKEWRDLINAELVKLDLPRPLPIIGRLEVVTTLRFAVRRNQERTNYFDFVTKQLGDCLRGGHPNMREGETQADHPVGWIVDDKDHHWESKLFINHAEVKGPRSAQTHVRLFWREAEPVFEKVDELPPESPEPKPPATVSSTPVPDAYPGRGPEERKLRNRLYFARHGVWPASVCFMERIERAGGSVDEEVADDAVELARLMAGEVKRELRRQ